jgi:hypothetical protein
MWYRKTMRARDKGNGGWLFLHAIQGIAIRKAQSSQHRKNQDIPPHDMRRGEVLLRYRSELHHDEYNVTGYARESGFEAHRQ